MALSDFFVWGQNGQQLTQDEIERRRAVADALMKNSVDYSPVASWTQGAARVAQGVLGALEDRSLDRAQKDYNDNNAKMANDAIAAYLGGVGGGAAANPTPSVGSSSIPMSGAASEIRATSPVDISGLSKNDVYNGFMDTVKTGITNPYGLAAVAATGTAESRFDPGNVGRTWSDPSESGQPGTAGGIMSWRGPRYNALAATGDLTPSGQGKFFLQENPQLIASLNNAKSVEEAQNLMNNAWAFKGYNIPGNANAASRLATARSLLPSFQQMASAEPQTATDAIASASPPQTQPMAQTPQALAYASPAAAKAPYVDPTVVNVGPKVADASAAVSPRIVQALGPQANSAPQGTQRVAQALAASQPASGASAPTSMNPAIIKAITDPRASPQTRAIGQILMQQALKPVEYGFQTLPDGTILRTDPRRGTVSPVYQAAPKPVEVNGRLVDPTNGRVIADYSNPQVTAVDGALIDNRTGQPLYRSTKPMDVNGHLVDPTTGQQIADYSNPNVSDVNGTLVDQRTGKIIYQGAPKGVTVEPGSTLVNPQTGGVLYQGTGYKPSDVTDLRKEIQQLPNYKAYQQAAPVYSSMIDTAKTDSKASDLNLVYGLGKIMDPNSVVREGEMVMVNNTSSLPDWLMGAINSVNGGSKLEPATRSAILREAKSRMSAYRGVLDNDLGQYRGIIQRRGMNEQDIIPTLNPVADVPDLSAAPTPAPAAPVTGITSDWQDVAPGVRIRKVN